MFQWSLEHNWDTKCVSGLYYNTTEIQSVSVVYTATQLRYKVCQWSLEHNWDTKCFSGLC